MRRIVFVFSLLLLCFPFVSYGTTSKKSTLDPTISVVGSVISVLRQPNTDMSIIAGGEKFAVLLTIPAVDKAILPGPGDDRFGYVFMDESNQVFISTVFEKTDLIVFLKQLLLFKKAGIANQAIIDSRSLQSIEKQLLSKKFKEGGDAFLLLNSRKVALEGKIAAAEKEMERLCVLASSVAPAKDLDDSFFSEAEIVSGDRSFFFLVNFEAAKNESDDLLSSGLLRTTQ